MTWAQAVVVGMLVSIAPAVRTWIAWKTYQLEEAKWQDEIQKRQAKAR